MTTTARSAAHHGALALPGLGLGLAWVCSTSVATFLVAVVVDGGIGPAGYGALVGSALLVGFFGFGGIVVSLASTLVPRLSMLVALTTYTLQVALLAAVYAQLSRSGVLDDRIDARWLSVTVIAGALAWSLALVVGSLRARQPIYDIPEPGEARIQAEVRGK